MLHMCNRIPEGEVFPHVSTAWKSPLLGMPEGRALAKPRVQSFRGGFRSGIMSHLSHPYKFY